MGKRPLIVSSVTDKKSALVRGKGFEQADGAGRGGGPSGNWSEQMMGGTVTVEKKGYC